MSDKVLFETEVGSSMWGMHTEESNRDIISVYQQSTKDILHGYARSKNKPQKSFTKYGHEWDYQFMEIEHLINLLIKGNINAIWAVTTPVVLTDSSILNELREITVTNLSKASYQSINGMAISNMNDNAKRPQMRPNKAYKQCLRSLTFGINMFRHGKVIYTPIPSDYIVTKEEIEDAFNQLNDVFQSTTLINNPREDIYRDFLYSLRISDLG